MPSTPSRSPYRSQSLTQGFRCDSAHFEITSKCNLSCVYCAVSQPDYHGLILAPDQATKVADWLLANNVTNINLNGHGETTIVSGWEKIVQPLLGSKWPQKRTNPTPLRQPPRGQHNQGEAPRPSGW